MVGCPRMKVIHGQFRGRLQPPLLLKPEFSNRLDQQEHSNGIYPGCVVRNCAVATQIRDRILAEIVPFVDCVLKVQAWFRCQAHVRTATKNS
jgi:hypothetical protein